MLLSRDLWSDSPPEPRTRITNYPTLLFSWWCTGFALVIILARVIGRKIRAGRIFPEDWIALFSIVPLCIRMALVHVILIYGTNNVQTAKLTAEQIHLRTIGARLVLASRIFYAMFIWVSKVTVSEFLKRLARASWKQSHQRGLYFIRIFLVFTFVVVVIATLTECQPFDHYWQVVPDPGPRCRQGFAQLISMGVADIITDILLVIWPIPIIVRSRMPLMRKISTVFLFSLSLGLIGITGTRVPLVIKHQGRQQYRTVWASIEILASAAVANAVVLGSFVRDRGIKRNKYRPGNSALDSIDRVSTRRPTVITIPNDSDEDLFRAMGCRLPPELCEPTSPMARPAPVALPSSHYFMTGASPSSPLSNRQIDRVPPQDSISSLDFPRREEEEEPQSPHDSADALPKDDPPLATVPSVVRSVTFFDVGGLLEDRPSTSTQTPSTSTQSGIMAHDFAPTTTTAAVIPQRNFRNPFAELGERLTPGLGRWGGSSSQPRASAERARGSHAVERPRNSGSTVERSRGSDATTAERVPSSSATESSSLHRLSLRPTTERGGSAISLKDVGGLLGS